MSPFFLQVFENQFGVYAVFLGIRGVENVEADVETGIVADMVLVRLGDELLGRDVPLERRSSMGVPWVSSAHDEHHAVAAQFLVADEDIGLHGFEQMPQVDVAIGIGERHGDEKAFLTGCGRASGGMFAVVPFLISSGGQPFLRSVLEPQQPLFGENIDEIEDRRSSR